MISAVWSAVCFGQGSGLKEKYLRDSLTIIAKRVENSIIRARYMEGKLIAITDTMKDWTGVKVSLYEYKFGEHTARVYMANADAKKIAAWIITACVTLTNNLAYKDSRLLIDNIRSASGGQFPVKGIVYEDGFPYIFKDGVTVSLYNTTTSDLNLITDANIKETKKFGRIISTTRQQYNRIYPDVNTNGHEWRTVVRKEYIRALNSDTNNLITAWAKEHLK